MGKLEMMFWISVASFSLFFGVVSFCITVWFFYHNPLMFFGTLIGFVIVFTLLQASPFILKALEELENE